MKKISLTALFVIILSISVLLTDRALIDKNPHFKYTDFFEEKDSFDVLFFGSSHVELSIAPLELWDKYGILSYNFGNPEESIMITYHLMENAFAYNKPRVAVVDLGMFGLGTDYLSDEHVHFALDEFPLNKQKINAINDLIKDNNKRLEMVFKIAKYHSRWKNLSEADFNNTEKYFKGGFSYGHYRVTKVFPLNENVLIGEDDICENNLLVNSIDENTDFDSLSNIDKDIIYIDKIINLCKEQNVELVFTVNPYECPIERQQAITTAEKYIEYKKLPCIDYVRDRQIVDFETDFYDEGHVNMKGLHILTSDIGEYLVNNYKLSNTRANNASWQVSLTEYNNLKYESIMWYDDLDAVLMMLNDDNIKVDIYYKDGAISEDINEKLYTNLNRIDNPEILYSDINKDDLDIVILISDKDSGELKLVKTYIGTDEGYLCDNVYNNFPFKYLFG